MVLIDSAAEEATASFAFFSTPLPLK